MLMCTEWKMHKSAVILLFIPYLLEAVLISKPNATSTCVGNEAKIDWKYSSPAQLLSAVYRVQVPGGTLVPILLYTLTNGAVVQNNYNVRWDSENGSISILNPTINNTGSYSVSVSYTGGLPSDSHTVSLSVLESDKSLGCPCANLCALASSTCSATCTTCSGKCTCASSHYDDDGDNIPGGICQLKKPLGDSCGNGSIIKCADTNSECRPATATCMCKSGYYDDNGDDAPGGSCSTTTTTTTTTPISTAEQTSPSQTAANNTTETPNTTVAVNKPPSDINYVIALIIGITLGVPLLFILPVIAWSVYRSKHHEHGGNGQASNTYYRQSDHMHGSEVGAEKYVHQPSQQMGRVHLTGKYGFPDNFDNRLQY